MITILYNGDMRKWWESLKIRKDEEEAQQHFLTLQGIIEDIKQYEQNQIPHQLIVTFGAELMDTRELIDQITKLIFKHFE